ncbi:hypothetical protein STEG23_026079, partial [Scotinomys teguina]
MRCELWLLMDVVVKKMGLLSQKEKLNMKREVFAASTARGMPQNEDRFSRAIETEFLCVVLVPVLDVTLLCRSAWPQTHRDSPGSASQVLGLK